MSPHAPRLLAVCLTASLAVGCGAFQGDVLEPSGGSEALAVRVSPVLGAPISRVGDAAVGWTGDEYVVVGGVLGDEKFGDDGEPETADDGPVGRRGASAVAYDPAADSWRELPTPPLARRSRATTAWTGDELLVWGGSGERNGVGGLLDAAAYDPATDSWRELPDAPAGTDRSWAQAVVVGDRVVFGGGAARAPEVDGDLLLFDLVSERWRSIEGEGRVTHLVRDGDTVLVLRRREPVDADDRREWVVQRFDPRSGATDVVTRVTDDSEGEEFFRGAGLVTTGGEVHLLLRYANGPTRVVPVLDADGPVRTTVEEVLRTVPLGVPGDPDGFGRPPTLVVGGTTLAVADAQLSSSVGIDPSVPVLRAVGLQGEQRCVNGLGWAAGPEGELFVTGGDCAPELVRATLGS